MFPRVVCSSIWDSSAVAMISWLSETSGRVEHFLFCSDSLGPCSWLDMTRPWPWTGTSLQSLFHECTLTRFRHRHLVILVLHEIFLLILQIECQLLIRFNLLSCLPDCAHCQWMIGSFVCAFPQPQWNQFSFYQSKQELLDQMYIAAFKLRTCLLV